jgi:hypothetical protein
MLWLFYCEENMSKTCRLLGRLFCFLLLMAVVTSWADPAQTTITGTLYKANGSPATGTLLISWPAFTTADQQAVAAGSISVPIGAGGAINVSLVPNEGSSPAGTYYRVVLRLDDGTVGTEYWLVPATSPTTVTAVRAQVMPVNVAVSPVTRQYVDNQLAGKVDSSAAVHTTGDETIAGVKTFTGSVMLAGNPTAPLQAATKQYVDNGVVNLSNPGPIGAVTPSSATFTDLMSKNTPVVNVLAYGAKNDCSADSSSAIVAAAQAAAAMNGTLGTIGTVLFPNGCYLAHEVDLSSLSGAVYLKAEHSNEAKIWYNGAGGVDSALFIMGGTHFGGMSGLRLYGTDGWNGTPTTIAQHILITRDTGTPNDMMGVWRDLTFSSACNNAIESRVLGYVNWYMDTMRFDSIGGYALSIKGVSGMDARPFVLSRFTYDNGVSSAVRSVAANKCPGGDDGVHWGKGFMAIDKYERSWAANTSFILGALILDSNGNVQQVSATAGAGLSGSSQPSWATSYGATTTDGNLTWKNYGAPVGALGMDITLRDSRIENNTIWYPQGNADEALIYEDNTASTAAGRITLQNIWGYFSASQQGVVLSTKNGKVELVVHDSSFSNIIAMVKNRSTQTYYGRRYGMYATNFRWGSNGAQNRGFEMEGRRFEANANNLSGNYGRWQAGDVVLHVPGEYTPGSTGVGRVVVSPSSGYAQTAGANATTAAVVTSGNAVVTNVNTRNSSSAILPGDNVVCVGCGASGADLTTIVDAVDFVNNTVTLHDTPSTSVNPATIRHVTPVFREWGMDATRMSAAPTTGTWSKGEVVWNSNPTVGSYTGWVNTAAGTPGSWQGFGLIGTPASAGMRYSGFCNNTASSSTTIALYGLGQIASAGCTSGVLNSGKPAATSAGTLSNLYVTAGTAGVNASSGACAIYKNGTATGIGCTIGTGTSCSDTTNTATVAAGDRLDVRCTTQASETLGSLYAQFEQH